MQRVAAVALAALVVLAGCSGDAGRPAVTGVPPTGPGEAEQPGNADIITRGFVTTAYGTAFSVPDFALYNGTDGLLVVEVTVRNEASSAREARLTVLAGAGNGTVRNSTVVALATNETTTRNVTLPVAYERWGGSLDFLWSPPNQTATTRPDR